MPQVPFSVIVLDWMVPNGGSKAMLDLEVKYAWIASVANFFFYILLYIYLDAIIPNSIGLS